MTAAKTRYRALLALVLASITSTVLAAVTAFDDEGTAVNLPAPARRIVSLAPHITEQLFAIGAGNSIVGTTDYADFPAEARDIPRVARAHSVDLERIAALRPDCILVPFRYDRHPDHLAVNRVVTTLKDSGATQAALLEYFVYHRWRLLPRRDVRAYLRPEHVLRLDIAGALKRKARCSSDS